jgi:hypothetical protein
MSNKVQVGTTITYTQPTYTDIKVSVIYNKYSQYSTEQVEQGIIDALTTRFSYTNMVFQDQITPEEVEYVLRNVDGLYNSQVKYLYRNGATAARTVLAGAPGEIFVLPNTSTNIVLEQVSKDATLASAAITGVTLTPSFSSNVYNYGGTGNSSIASTWIAAPATNSNATMTLTKDGGTPVEFTGSSAIYMATAGTYVWMVTVNAQDGVETKKYYFTIVRT